MTIAVVGSLGLDTIETPAGRVEEVLGGSAAYFALAARHFLPVSLVAVLGAGFPAEARAPPEHPHLDTSGLSGQQGETVCWGRVDSRRMETPQTLPPEPN